MAGDALLASTDTEDALCQVYVAAVAALAGYVTCKKDFDRDGVDITFEAGGHMRPKLDAQLKATMHLKELSTATDQFSYQCPKRNHDLLRVPTQVPRILIVLRLPKNPKDWLQVNDNEMVLKHCAYWANVLKEDEVKEGNDSKAVRILKANRFDAAALTQLMNQSRSGKIG
jgi:hypothetical protein